MTEGSNYIDTWGANNRTQARLFNLPRGYYHFARPDLNTPEAEAQFFIDVMNGQPLQEGESVYLDYEVQYTGDNVGWVLTWMQAVEKALGVKPIFYSYQSMLTSHDWSPVVNNGNGLWVATASNDPNNDNFETGAWPFAMMQQWGNQDIPGVNTGVVDSDVFYGDTNAFLAYGYKPPQPPPPPPPPADATTSQPVVNPSTPVVEVPDMLTPPVSPPPVVNQTPITLPEPTTTNFPTFIGWLEQLIAWLKMNSNVRPPTLNSATGRGLITIGQAFIAFLIGLILAVWKVPGVPQTVMNFVVNNSPALLLSFGVSSSVGVGLVSFLWNYIFRKNTVTTY